MDPSGQAIENTISASEVHTRFREYIMSNENGI